MTHRPYSRDTESRRKVSDAVELKWSRTPCHRLRMVFLSIETGPPSDGGRRQSGWPGGLPCMMLKAGRRPSKMQEVRLDLTNPCRGRRVLTFVGPLPSVERPIFCCSAPNRSRPIADFLVRLAFSASSCGFRVGLRPGADGRTTPIRWRGLPQALRQRRDANRREPTGGRSQGRGSY